MSLTDNHSFRLFTFVFLSLFVGFLLLYRCNDDGPRSRQDSTHRYQPLMNADLLPLMVFFLLPLGLLFVGPGRMAQLALSVLFQCFLHLAVYYALLLPSRPCSAGSSAPGAAPCCGSSPIFSICASIPV